jgi:hypothetical protein
MVSMLAPSRRIRLLVGHRSAPPGPGLQGVHVHHLRVAAVDVVGDRQLAVLGDPDLPANHVSELAV